MDYKKIIKGHMNEMLGNNTDLKDQRMSICKNCPLFKMSGFGPICNPDKFINPETDEIAYSKKEGYVRGCGCRLNAKTRDESSKCPAGKW